MVKLVKLESKFTGDLTMKYIEYHEDGKAVSDFELDNEYWNLISSNSDFSYSTENIFHRIRLGVLKDEINPENYVLVFKGMNFRMNKFGQINDWPIDFISQNSKLHELILQEMMNKF